MNQSIDKRRFSQCSAASSLSSSGSNTELSSLPINLNSYHPSNSILEVNTDHNSDDNKQFNTSVSTTLRSINKSPQLSPKHQTNQSTINSTQILNKSHNQSNSRLSKANSSSTASLLLSPIRTSSNSKLNQTSLMKNKSIKQVQTDSENRSRTYSASRIPQLNNSSSKQIITSTAKKSTNRSKQSTNQSNKETMANKIPASPNRRRSLATSASSTSLINSSTSSSIKQSLIRNQTKMNLNSSFTSIGRRNVTTGLTTNKLLSQSSSSIYNQLTNYNRLDKMRTNESPKRTIISKNSKLNVPLSRTRSTSSGLTNNQPNQNSANQNPNKQQIDKSLNESTQNNNPIILTNANSTANVITNSNHYLNSYTERQQKLKHLSTADLIVYRDNVKSMKGMNEWYSRDNVANFITACRNLFKIQDCHLFETDDLVMRKNERSFILCMLEIARIGRVYGLSSPLIGKKDFKFN